MVSRSGSSSVLGALGLGEEANQFLLDNLDGLLTPNAFLDGLPEVGGGDVDAALLNDGNDALLDTTMAEFLGEIERNQRKPVTKTSSKLETLLTMQPPSNVRRNKRTFRGAAVRSDQPSKKANVVIEIPDDVSPPTSRCSRESEVSPPKLATVDITTDRPLSPIIHGGMGRRRRSAAKAVKKTKKLINVEPASTSSSSSSSTLPDSSGSSASGASADWSGFSASQRDVFSRAFAKRCTIKTLLENESRALQRHESELAELRQKVREAENRVEHSKTVISKYKDNLLFLKKTFTD